MSEVRVKLISDLRLLTSVVDGLNDLNDLNGFNDFPLVSPVSPDLQPGNTKHLTLRALHFFLPLNGIETYGKFLVPRTHYFVQFLKLKILSEF